MDSQLESHRDIDMSHPRSQTEGSMDSALRRRAKVAFDAGQFDLVMRAFDATRTLMDSDRRLAIDVARLLIEQYADAQVIAAMLLMPLCRSHRISRKELRHHFGDSVADLIDEVCRTGGSCSYDAANFHGSCASVLHSASDDPRVVIALIGLRLIELEAMGSMGGGQIRALALEGRDLLVPLADALGLGALRNRLEDACFRVLEPDLYQSLAQSVAPIEKADDLCLNFMAEKVANVLDRNGVRARVSGRLKTLWGIHRKMRRHELNLDQIMDRLGLRVIVDSVPECYVVLGLIHSHFRPIPGTFDDYIGLPKQNGYQSLHTCVYPVPAISLKPVEFQIRTQAMHVEAEFGIAAHWRYKSEALAESATRRHCQWFHGLIENHDAAVDHDAFIAHLQQQVYEQSLVVFLRGGHQVRLPAGSTAHVLLTKVADELPAPDSVRINAQPRPLDTPLRDGDTVEWDEMGPTIATAKPLVGAEFREFPTRALAR